MQVTRQITNDITYVGVSDRRLSLFEIFPHTARCFIQFLHYK